MSKLKRLQHKQRKRRAKDETFVVRLKKKDVESKAPSYDGYPGYIKVSVEKNPAEAGLNF